MVQLPWKAGERFLRNAQEDFLHDSATPLGGTNPNISKQGLGYWHTQFTAALLTIAEKWK